MNGVRIPVQPGMIFVFFLFSMAWTGSQGVRAAILDGLLDGVEESLAEGLAKKGENLTTGNFYTDDKPNSHAAIGMMGDHTHEAGEVMFSYRFMQMFMEGTRIGTDSVSNEMARDYGKAVFPDAFPNHECVTGHDCRVGGYRVLPESMRMTMHMFGFMYGWNDTVTLTLMVPYLSNSMDHEVDSGVKFTTRSEGFGDLRFGSLWRLWAVEAPSIGSHRFHMNLSMSVPTGSIEPTDVAPVAHDGGPREIRLPYPMHLGSGTVDFYPGITYGGEMGRTSWGVQALGTLRLGRNSNNFSKGDAYTINVHGAYEVIPNTLSSSIRLSWNHWDAYDGIDSQINRQHICHRPAAGHMEHGGDMMEHGGHMMEHGGNMMNQPVHACLHHGEADLAHPTVQTAFPNLLGGQRLDLLFGINVLFPDFMDLENRLAVEGGFPIYQYLDGQLETDSTVTFGWQAVY